MSQEHVVLQWKHTGLMNAAAEYGRHNNICALVYLCKGRTELEIDKLHSQALMSAIVFGQYALADWVVAQQRTDVDLLEHQFTQAVAFLFEDRAIANHPRFWREWADHCAQKPCVAERDKLLKHTADKPSGAARKM